MAHDDDKVTTGEIFRRLCDMDERYEKKLDRIEDQVLKTNGRTTVLETNYANMKSQIRSLSQHQLPAPPLPVADVGEFASIRVSPKVWLVLAAAGGVLFPMVIKALKEWLQQP